jgi:hypothetical protein
LWTFEFVAELARAGVSLARSLGMKAVDLRKHEPESYLQVKFVLLTTNVIG